MSNIRVYAGSMQGPIALITFLVGFSIGLILLSHVVEY